jgi:hypothetical protein
MERSTQSKLPTPTDPESEHARRQWLEHHRGAESKHYKSAQYRAELHQLRQSPASDDTEQHRPHAPRGDESAAANKHAPRQLA